MSNATAAYEALTQFNESLVYQRTATTAELQGDLSVISEFDKEAERQSKKWGWRLFLGVLSVFGSIALTFFGFANNTVPVGIAGVAIAVVALGTAIFCGKNYSQWARRNIEDRRYLLINEMLRLLSCDMLATAPVTLRLDGNDYHKPQYRAEGGESLMASGQSAYRLPWLELSGQFVDGQRFQFNATQLVKRKERRKRKYTKVKEALRERVDLSMRCKTQKYARWAELPVVVKQLNLKLPLEAWDLQVTGDRVTLTGLMQRAVKVSGRHSSGSHDAGLLDLNSAVSLFALLYRGLDAVRK